MATRTTIALLLLLSSCSRPSTETAYEVRARAQYRETNTATLTEVRTSAVPEDFEAKIDAALDELLKDPASKILEYTAKPVGSLVCGKINAKNSYGAYGGKRPFFAFFGSDGALKGLNLDPNEHYWESSECQSAECALWVDKVLYVSCGFTPPY